MANIKMDVIPVGMIGTNCYIVYNDDSRNAVIIDPGDDGAKIIERVRKLNVKPQALLLTHGHFDHIMAAGDVASGLNIKIYILEQEKALIMDAGLNCSAGLYGNGYAIEPDVLIKDRQELELCETKVKVLHTPGHTKGSCCYYFENEGLLFCGDTLFMESVGRTDLPTGNGREIIRSLNDILFDLPDNVKAFPGHGPSTTIGYEKRNNPYGNGLF